MSSSTELRQIDLVGPPLAGLVAGPEKFTWVASVATAFQGEQREDKSLVGSTFGLRVLLQDLAPQQIKVGFFGFGNVVKMCPPRLLSGHLRARQYRDEEDDPVSTLAFPDGPSYRLRAPVPEADPDTAEETLGVFTVAVTPVDPWPTPQRSRYVEVPRFTLAEHRMRVLVNVKGGTKNNPLGFLRFAQIDANTVAAFVVRPAVEGTDVLTLPHIEMPLISLQPSADSRKKEPFVALDLTPEGIEMRATIVNPMQAFDPGAMPARLPVVLRLVHQLDPVSPESTVWTLELVREEDAAKPEALGRQIGDALSQIRRGFVPDQDKPVFVDIDTQAEVPAVRWPLNRNKDGSLSMLQEQANENWRLWVDAKALDVSLTGVPLRGTELPTVVKIAADRLQIVAAGPQVIATLDADRRDPADRRAEPDKVTGPHVVVDWATSTSRQLSVRNDDNKPVPWFIDPDALACELVARYTRKGVQPPMASRTHAFVPVADGWLQLPLALPSQLHADAVQTSVPAAPTLPRDAVPFGGPFETLIPEVGADGPNGRRLTLLAADRIAVRATFTGGLLTSIRLSLLGAAGTADGILWFATGSPTPEEVLPGLAAGPASLVGPPLQFRRETKSTTALSRLYSNEFSPADELVLTLPKVSADDVGRAAYAWLGYSELPLVTAIPITRTSVGSGLPSQTRGLLCRVLDRSTLDITLTYKKEGTAPTLGLRESSVPQAPHKLPLAGPNSLKEITLVAVTTTGIELQPAADLFGGLKTRLSYQPPVLIDYFASVRLPQTTSPSSPVQGVPVPPPIDTPTSLDMPALFEAWQRAVDRMDLARVKEGNAFDDEFVSQQAGQVSVSNLFGGTAWSTNFGLQTSATIGTRTLAMGTYQLNGVSYAGERALVGLTMAFAINGSALTPANAATVGPLAIVGFATGAWKEPGSDMWRDSRAAYTAEMPKVVALGTNPLGLVYREIRVVGKDGMVDGWRTTLSLPVGIESPPGNAGRSLALWFRDLFLQAAGPQVRQFKSGPTDLELAIGPLQSAFDADQLPKALYEWRFCNDGDGQSAEPSLYDIAIGPFRFRPLRLFALTLKEGVAGGVTEATVVGSLSPPGEDLTSTEKGPFGPDPAYRTGNLLAVSLKRTAQGKLTFAGAKWKKARVASSLDLDGKRELSFRRVDVPVHLGKAAGDAFGQTVLRIDLPFKDDDTSTPLPSFDLARMETILFGRRVVYEKGKVLVDDNQIVVSFKNESTTAMTWSGVRLDEVWLVWSSTDGPRLELEGVMCLQASDARADGSPPSETCEVIWQRLGGPLWWLNLQVPTREYKVRTDHQRGTLSFEVDWKDSPNGQPVAGLVAVKPDIRASLTMALTAPDKAAPSAYAFPSRAGFGALSLLCTSGPTRRFDQVLLADRPNDPSSWRSRIEVDLTLESHPSRIHWPVGSLPDRVGPPKKAADIDLRSLASKVTGRALSGEITAYADATTLRHRVTLSVRDQRLPTDMLHVDGRETSRRVALNVPWTFTALAEHSITSGDKTKNLSWTTLDHVTAVDVRQLLVGARDALVIPSPLTDGDFAFAARLKVTDQAAESAPVIKAGLVLRAFAQAGFPVEALARHLVDGMFTNGELDKTDLADGIVVTGAGATSIEFEQSLEGPFWPAPGGATPRFERHGLLLSLPWLTAVEPDYDFGPAPKKLAAFMQAPARGTRQWDAPDIDWAAGSLMPLTRASAPVVSPGSGSAPELASMFTQLGMSAGQGPRLQPVEQVFLRSALGAADPISNRPLWLHSLLALRAWSRAKETNFSVTMLVPLDAGQVARFRLAPTAPKPEAARFGQAGQLIAIERELTLTDRVPLLEAQGGFQEARHRARLVARAERLVKEPIAVVAVAPKRSAGDTAATLWTSVQVPADLDDAALDIATTLVEDDRLYASPALGWPTSKGTALAASGALGLGDDFPFQDLPEASEADGEDVRTFGSGLSGRVTSLSLPARADNSQEAGSSTDKSFIDVQSPVFLALGRKIIFDRPTDLPVVSPPARHLSPTEARAVVPVADDLRTALARVVQGHAAPIVPPLLERATLGMRPGAMAAEFDMLLFTKGQAEEHEMLDSQFNLFGRPGHAGPRLLRQHRPPRAPALPRVPKRFVKSHGRRTYVEIDEVERVGAHDIAKPFLLLEGVGTVLRNAGQSFRIRILHLPLRPSWNGALSLHVSSASHAAGGNALAKALAKLGVLHTEARASLTINGHVLPFAKAHWQLLNMASGGLVLTLTGADLSSTRSSLEAVDGDSVVFLSFRCGTQAEGNSVPPSDFDIAPAAAVVSPAPLAQSPLTPETQRHFSLRLPVRPETRPSLSVTTSTLVFADPSYDRTLAGPGAADTQRDGEGKQWKLALDRQEYGTDTPLYLALGWIDSNTGLFVEPPSPPLQAELTFQRQPASLNGGAPVAPEDLEIAGLVGKKYVINIGTAYGITFESFRKDKQAPVVFLPGDQIVVSIAVQMPGLAQPSQLSVRANVVSRPIIAPPPAVYALVIPDGELAARVVLHATAPLPQVIEFPQLLDDLAVGHVRRAALFIWPTQALVATGPKEATLVKVDRAGGGQVPDKPSDLQNILLLPTLQ